MGKRLWYLLGRSAVCLAFLLVRQTLSSQVSNPASWSDFVWSDKNVLLRDTFRMQTFRDSPWDDWHYTADWELNVVSSSSVKVGGIRSDQLVEFPLGQRLSFARFPQGIYENLRMVIRWCGEGLQIGEELWLRTYRTDEAEEGLAFKSPEKNDTDYNANDVGVKNASTALDIFTTPPAANTKNGRYYLDSVYACGYIPTYSLFTGSGDWDDSARWSHQPAHRHRVALIQGEATISDRVRCDGIAVAQGHLRLDGGTLVAQELTIHSTDATTGFSSSGELQLAGCVTVEWTLPERGKWYFLSLPFDLYADGLDPDFRLGDDTEQGSGNILYFQRYNGERRATSQSLRGNWEVIPKKSASSVPLLRKNQGYLIALDAQATTRSVRFTSKAGDIPVSFGREGTLSVQAFSQAGGTSSAHDGWYLCGNPLPAPLPLRRIAANSALDGYAYVYDGSTYQRCALDSDYAIAPFSAFFVKASRSTTLTVERASASASYRLLSSSHSLSTKAATEPYAFAAPVGNRQALPLPVPNAWLEGDRLRISNLSSAGAVELFDRSGKRLLVRQVGQGDSTLPLTLPAGIYLIRLRSGDWSGSFKCVVR